MKVLKRVSAIALSACLAFLVACGGGASSSAPSTAASGDTAQSGTATVVAEGASVSQEKDIVAAVEVDITTMDPVDTSDTLSGGVQRLIMDGLFGFDNDMNVIPMLATEYEANEEATEFTFKLREGVTFTDGTAWNADAAVANFAKWGDKTLGLKRTSLLSNMLDNVEVVDEYTIKVNLVESFGAFINTLAHPAMVIMSPKQIEAGVDACKEEAIGTGQYKFVEWIPGDHVTVELNKDWWGYSEELTDGKPLAEKDAGFKSITFKPVPESTTRVSMLQANDAQIMWLVPTESVELLKSDANVAVETRASLIARYIFLNTQKEPFNDVRVRQAINYALDKEAYVQVVDNGLAGVPDTIIGPDTQFAKKQTPYDRDLEKAKKLLADAGYPDGFESTLIATNTGANTKRAQFIQQQLAEVGIKITIIQEESAVVNDKIQGAPSDGKEAVVEMHLSGWSSSTGDADWALRPVFASESVPPNSFNISYYNNPEFDQLLKDGLATADPAVREAAYAKAQDILWEDCPVITTSIDFMSWATSSKVVNVSLYPDGAINLRNARMAE